MIRTVVKLGWLVVLLIAAILAWILATWPATTVDFQSNKPVGVVLTASSVVVRPWLGEHHVYGVFDIPDAYTWPRFVGKLIVANQMITVELDNRGPVVHGRTVAVPPGYYVVHEHLETRVAIWLIVTGRLGLLASPANWHLIIVKRENRARQPRRVGRAAGAACVGASAQSLRQVGRDRHIVSCGYAPFLIPQADESGVHGNNERISIENVRTGTEMMFEIVKTMVGGQP